MIRAGGKFKLRVSPEVSSPWVPTPAGLIVVLVLCTISMVTVLVYGVAAQLDPQGIIRLNAFQTILFVTFGAVCPLLIVHAIATNRPSSRSLIALNVVGAATLLGSVWQLPERPFSESIIYLSGILAFVGLAVWWLFRSPRMRTYYAILNGHASSSDHEALFKGESGHTLVRVLKGAGPFLELAGIVLVLVGIAAGLYLVWGHVT